MARLRAAGAEVHRAPALAGGRPKGTLTARRPVLEYAVAAAAADRVDIRRGVRATAWACTSPALGRGLTLGLMHAAVVAESVAAHVKDPLKLALDCDRLTRERILPWYRDSIIQASKHAAQLSVGPRPASCHPS